MLRLLPLLFLLQFEGSTAGDCTQSNDFEFTECEDACCAPSSACVKAKDQSGDNDVGVCSKNRSLWGGKAITIVVIPLLGSILTIVMAIYSLKGILSAPVQGHGKAVAIMCLVELLISWPMFLSMYWYLGLYSFFLCLLTIASAQWTDRVWWLYRLVWIMQVFQIIAFFGAYEPFHVPFFRFSGEEDGSQMAANKIVLDFSHELATCSAYYGNYFDMLDIELNAHQADPNYKYFGLCTEGWLGCIHLDFILVGILWMVICALSTPILMAADPAKAAKISMEEVPGTEAPWEELVFE